MNLREKKGKNTRDKGNPMRPAIFKIVSRICCFLFRTCDAYVDATNCISLACTSVIRGLKNCMRRNYEGRRTTEDKRDGAERKKGEK